MINRNAHGGAQNRSAGSTIRSQFNKLLNKNKSPPRIPAESFCLRLQGLRPSVWWTYPALQLLGPLGMRKQNYGASTCDSCEKVGIPIFHMGIPFNFMEIQRNLWDSLNTRESQVDAPQWKHRIVSRIYQQNIPHYSPPPNINLHWTGALLWYVFGVKRVNIYTLEWSPK